MVVCFIFFLSVSYMSLVVLHENEDVEENNLNKTAAIEYINKSNFAITRATAVIHTYYITGDDYTFVVEIDKLKTFWSNVRYPDGFNNTYFAMNDILDVAYPQVLCSNIDHYLDQYQLEWVYTSGKYHEYNFDYKFLCKRARVC